MESSLTDQAIVRYLLGEASDQEEHDLEEQYFGDDRFFEHLQMVEEELIDAYVGSELDARERERFEQHFLVSPERRRRVEFAKALLSSSSLRQAPHQEKRSWWAAWPALWRIPQPLIFASAAALVVLGIVGFWSVTQSRSLRNELARLQAGQQQLQSERQSLQEQLEQERTERSRLETALKTAPSKIATFLLMPGTLRSADEARSLLIRRDTDLVQLQLPIDDAAAVQYRVAVRTAEDREIWSQDGLQSQNMPAGKAIVLSLPANLLPAGDYVVLVRAVTASGDIEDAGQFSFKTVRR